MAKRPDDLESRIMAAQPNPTAVPANAGGLEKKIAEPAMDDTGWNFKQIAKDTAKFSPIAAFNWLVSGGLSYLAGATSFLAASSTLFAPIGYVGAKIIRNWREKKKTTWYDVRKEIALGNFIGVAAYWLYQIPEYFISKVGLSTKTFLGKVAKTMTFNPGMYLPFIAAYMPTVYIRDNIGTKKALKGIFNGKLPGYFKEAYEKDMKKNYWPTLRKASVVMFPSHLATIGYNLVTMPALRVGIGALHDLVFALIAGSKKKEAEELTESKEKLPLGQRMKDFYKSIPKKLDNFFRVPGYEPAYKPAVATT